MTLSSLLVPDSPSLCRYLLLLPKQENGFCRKGTDTPLGSSHGEGEDNESHIMVDPRCAGKAQFVTLIFGPGCSCSFFLGQAICSCSHPGSIPESLQGCALTEGVETDTFNYKARNEVTGAERII